MKYTLEKLEKLTELKDYTEIQNILKNEDPSYKGKLFEEYVGLLYKGNGYIVSVIGGKGDGGADILLSNPDFPSNIIWVIQCKNWTNPLDETNLISEISKYERKAKLKYKNSSYKIISVSGYTDCLNVFKDIDVSLEDFSYVKSLIDNYKMDFSVQKPIMPDLKPHNIWSYKEASALLEKYNKVTIPNATGTGKSYIAAQFIYDFIGKKALVLSPNKESLNAIERIAIWSKNYTKYVTYSKLSKQNLIENTDYSNLDLIILDEIHRTGAREWGKSVRQLLSLNKKAKVIGLSATPKRYLDNNRNMITEMTDGIHTNPLTLFDCIVRGILPNPKYITALYNIDIEIEKALNILKDKDSEYTTKRNNLYKIKQEFSNSNFIVSTIQKYAPKNSNGLKFIVFCENKKHLNEIYPDVIKWLSQSYGLKYRIKPSIVVSGQTGNKKELECFENDSSKNIKVLFCIDKLNEGVHLKNGGIDGIFLLRKTTSPNIYLQQIGRVFDCSKAISEPIIFDFVNNIENMNSNYFKDNLNESKDRINENRVKLGLSPLDVEIKNFKELPDILDEIKNVEKYTSLKWEDYIDILKEYKETFKVKFKNPKTMTLEEKDSILNNLQSLKRTNITLNNLFNWCCIQKDMHVTNKLEKDKLNSLININFFNEIVDFPETRDFETFKFNLDICKKEILEYIKKSEQSLSRFIKAASHPLFVYDFEEYKCIKLGSYFLPGKYFEKSTDSIYKITKRKPYTIEKEPSDIFYSKYSNTTWLLLETKKYLNGKLEEDKYNYFKEFLEEIDLSDHIAQAEKVYVKNLDKLKNEIEKHIVFYLKSKETLLTTDDTRLFWMNTNRLDSCKQSILTRLCMCRDIKEGLSAKEIQTIAHTVAVCSLDNRRYKGKIDLMEELYDKPYIYFSTRDYLIKTASNHLKNINTVFEKYIA